MGKSSGNRKNSIQTPVVESVILTASKILMSQDSSYDYSEHGNVNEEADHEGGALLTERL
jgi:hypothetical protein